MRLIDADSLLKHLFVTESRTGGSVYAQAYEKGWDDALKAVMAYEPTAADAVEVVRCKDCAIRFDSCPMVVRVGSLIQFFTEDEDFCSRGRREP